MYRPAVVACLGMALIASTAAAPAKKRADRPGKAAVSAAAPAPTPEVPLSPAQLDAAGRVLTGSMACEFDQNIRVMPVEGKPGHFKLALQKATYTLVPQETTTGAVRLEDRGAGIVWLQIPAKSMLLNARNGRRLVDGCQHEDQRVAADQPASALGIVAVALADASGQSIANAVLSQPALAPQQVLSGPLQRSSASISPDGQWLAWIAPREGVDHVWVAPTSAPDASRAIPVEQGRGIQSFSFARDGRHLLYALSAREEAGGESVQIHAFDLVGGGSRPISPKGSRATIVGLSDALGGEVLISVNDRDPRYYDPVRVVIASGERTRVLENDGLSRIVSDANFSPRYASRARSDGGNDWFMRQGDAWRPLPAVAAESGAAKGTAPNSTSDPSTAVIGLSADGATLYLSESRGPGAAALYAMDTPSGVRRLLLEGARRDAGALMIHPVTGLAQAARPSGPLSRWVAMDTAIAADLQRLETLAAGGEFSVSARTRADQTWLVTVERPDAAARVYLYDRSSGTSKLLLEGRPA